MDETYSPMRLTQSEDVYLPELPEIDGLRISKSTMGPGLPVRGDSILVETVSEDFAMDEVYIGMSFFHKELEMIDNLEKLRKKSCDILSLIYSFRSAAVAIPDVSTLPYPDHDDASGSLVSRQLEYNSKVIEVLRPGIMKLKQ